MDLFLHLTDQMTGRQSSIKIVISGGMGFVGARLAEYHVERGDTV